MKKYKVIKEFEVGNNSYPTYHVPLNEDNATVIFLKENNLIDKYLEEVKPELTYKPFNPEEDEKYWHVDSWGDIENTKFDNMDFDKWNAESGNCFRTKEEAEYHRDWLIARKRIMDSSDFVPDWEDKDQYKYFVNYSYYNNSLFVGSVCGNKNSQIVFYETEEQAEQAIKDLENEYLVYFEVKRSLDEN